MSANYTRFAQLRGDTLISSGDSPANAHDPDSAQPTGTRFMALGENVTSPAANRALKAIQDNVDILHAQAFSEVAIPKMIDITADLSASELSVVVDTPTTAVPLRVYVDDSAPSPAGESGIFQVLDEGLNEITNSSGTVCQVSAIVSAAGETGLSGGATLQLTDAMAISAIKRHSVTATLGSYSFTQAPNTKVGSIYRRPACPGDTVVIAGNHASNNTDAGTRDWVVHKVISANEVEVRCVQDPSRSLDTSSTLGTVQIKSNGEFYVNPTVTLNFNPIDDGGATTVYLVYGHSRQPIASVAVPAAATYPFESSTFMKVELRAAEENEDITARLSAAGLDTLYDRKVGPKQDNEAGSGRQLNITDGPIKMTASVAGLATEMNSMAHADLLGGGTQGLVGFWSSRQAQSAPSTQVEQLGSFMSGGFLGEDDNTISFAKPGEFSSEDEFDYDDEGVDLSRVVPYATLAYMDIGENSGYFVVTDVSNVEKKLTLRELDGGTPSLDMESGNATLYSAEFWAGRHLSLSGLSSSYGGARHALQLVQTKDDCSALRTLHSGDAGSDPHIMCLGLSSGNPYKLFRVDSSNVETAVPIKHTGSGTRKLDLDYGALQTIARLSSSSEDAGVQVLAENSTDSVSCYLNLMTLGGSPEAHLAALKASGTATIYQENTSASGSLNAIVRSTSITSFRVTSSAAESPLTKESIGTSSWKLHNSNGGAERFYASFASGDARQFLLIDGSDSVNSSYGLCFPAKDFGEAVGATVKSISLNFGAASNTGVVHHLRDTNRTTDLVTTHLGTSTFGGTPGRFLALACDEHISNAGGLSTFALDDLGNVYLGAGFSKLQRNGDLPVVLGAAGQMLRVALTDGDGTYTEKVRLGADGTVWCATGVQVDGGYLYTSAGNIYADSGNVFTSVGNVFTSNGNVYAEGGELYVDDGRLHARKSINADPGPELSRHVARIRNSHTTTTDGHALLKLSHAEFSTEDTGDSRDEFLSCYRNDSDGDSGTLVVALDGAGNLSSSLTVNHWVVLQHVGEAEDPFGVELEPGMLISSTGVPWTRASVSMAIPICALSATPKDPNVFGVLSAGHPLARRIAHFHMFDGKFHPSSESPQTGKKNDECSYDAGSPYHKAQSNSGGEGLIWVTDCDGQVASGDYITSSHITGYGMKQDDDILHNYTVAKCTEDIPWDEVTDTIEVDGQTVKKYLAACTYHCG